MKRVRLLALLLGSLLMLTPACDDGTAQDATDAGDLDGNTPDGLPDPDDESSSVDLIREAEDQGLIDGKTAAFYELLAQFAPGRLPAEFAAASPLSEAPSIVPAIVARANLDAYPPTQAAAVRAMLTDPEDPEWMSFPAELPVHNAGAGRGCRANFDAENGGGRFVGPAINTRHFRIRPIGPKLEDVPGQEALRTRIDAALAAPVPGVGGQGSIAFGEYLDQTFEFFRDTLKMRDPTTVLEKPKMNDGRIPIYVATCDGATNDAFAESGTGFIFATVGLAMEDNDLRRVVIPHEVFHVFEAAYGLGDVTRDRAWPFEAAAVAIEDLVAPDVRRWSGEYRANPNGPPGIFFPMDRFFKCPEEPLHSSHGGSCKQRGSNPGRAYGGEYSRFVVFKYLMRNESLELSDFWTQYASAGGDPTGLFVESQLGELQIALLGDVQGQEPYFEPEDRTAFNGMVDRAPEDVRRYTYRLDPTAFEKSAAVRMTGQELSSTAPLKKFESGPLPLLSGGTHRILLEMPPEVDIRESGYLSDDYVRVALDFEGAASVAVNVASIPAGAPLGRLLSPGPSGTALDRGGLPMDDFWMFFDDEDPPPAYLLLTITNFADNPVTYQGAINLPHACLKSCADQTAQYLLDIGCAQEWCEDDNQPAVCAAQYTTADTRNYAMITYCRQACTPISGLNQPLPPDDDTCGDYRAELCSVSPTPDCEQCPVAFMSIPRWPDIECNDIMGDCF